MRAILPGIIELLQHIKKVWSDINFYRPKCCIHCGKSGLWFHGYYYRKSDRRNSRIDSLNPVPIPRFFCKHCGKTTSVLPECIAPHRWYIWNIQQVVFLQILLEKSLRAVSETTSISRSTCRRWWNRFKERFLLHGATLRVYYPKLGSQVGFHNFWVACLKQMTLDKAMLLCHQSGVSIP